MDFSKLYTVRDIVDRTGGILTEGQLRWWIFKAETNGLKSAIVKIGKRVYIDGNAFNMWLESHRQGPPSSFR